MSVRKGDRGEGKLQVLNKARELKRYSLERVKTFPKSTRWLYREISKIHDIRAEEAGNRSDKIKRPSISKITL